MERFEYGAVVIKLRKRSIKRNEEGVVDTRMTDIVSDGRDQEGETIERLQQRRYWRFRLSLRFGGFCGIRR